MVLVRLHWDYFLKKKIKTIPISERFELLETLTNELKVSILNKPEDVDTNKINLKQY